MENFFKSTKLRSGLILGFYLALMVGCAYFFQANVSQERLHEIVGSSGNLGIFIYFLIEVVYVTFTPLLNTFVLIASGYIFGGHLGFFINFFATTLGLFLIVFLVRKFGRPLLQKVVSPKIYSNFDKIIERVGPITLLVVYVLPFTPDDELTYIVAAGPIKFRRFILPVLLGTVAKSAYSYIGEMDTEGITIAVYFRVVLLVIGLIVVGIQEYLIKKISQ